MKCHYQLVEYFFKPKYTNGNRGETMLKIKFTLTLGEKMFYWSKIRVLIEISSINFIFWSIKLTVFFLFLRSIWSFLIKISVSSLLTWEDVAYSRILYNWCDASNMRKLPGNTQNKGLQYLYEPGPVWNFPSNFFWMPMGTIFTI